MIEKTILFILSAMMLAFTGCAEQNGPIYTVYSKDDVRITFKGDT